ncbi:MAG: cyclic nucleotide-binding domain-containing protein [Chloroflexi bacterium]|nr:cyclic nucleotide-binding domain-containing protein [Chloroflexota bacterium]MDA1271758.1 cyclic nucleotide-binding domain-containing protein [Chloroflexota bacterium]
MTTDGIGRTLSDSDLFGSLTQDDLAAILPLATSKSYQGGVTLFRQNQKLDTLYVVDQGLVHLTMGVQIWERGAVLTSIVSSIEKGGTFGWPALVEPNLATFAAETVGRCQLIEIEAPKLRELMEQDHSLGFRLTTNLVNLVADRLRATQESVQSLRAEDLKEHL